MLRTCYGSCNPYEDKEMSHITVITVGNLKEAYLRDAVAEYKKRLSQYARVDEIELREERVRDENDRTEIERALDREAEHILNAMPKESLKIALCVEGKEYSSEGLAELISKGIDQGGRICLVIGSSHGMSPKVKEACSVRLSFSKLTFPHQLMKVILMEALYRSFTIIHKKSYHK